MSNPVTVQNIINSFRKELAEHYPPREIESMYQLIFEHILNYSKIDIHLNKECEIDGEQLKKIMDCLPPLKKQRPIQYVLGETEFYDLSFEVNEHTLIPRPETEELVHWILNESLPPAPRILDIGTGSGCIPITLAHNISKAQVMSVDISPQALETAQRNARRNNTKVDFQHRDILNWEHSLWPSPFHLIVSNPPYVRESEKTMMERNVLDYEPSTALFVTDEDPLIFYRTIAAFARENLYPEGKLFFEINEHLGQEMILLLKEMGFTHITLRKDINERDRMISATWPAEKNM